MFGFFSLNVTIIKRYICHPKMTTPIVHRICYCFFFAYGPKKGKAAENFFSGELPEMSRVDALSITDSQFRLCFPPRLSAEKAFIFCRKLPSVKPFPFIEQRIF